jgi:Cdc6-like AAA superfamily ATPase
MWVDLGFHTNPYSTSPLRAKEEDVDLLIGRSEESVEFVTALDSSEQGVIVLSGVPGVGKTSFFNIQQYLLERKKVGYGPKIISSRELCPIQPGDTPTQIALRALKSLVKSLELYCKEYEQKIPDYVKGLSKWINQQKNSKGVNIGLEAFGFGANFGKDSSNVSVDNLSYESIVDILKILVEKSLESFEAEGLVIALDNIENLDEEYLGSILITFRDTLFSIDKLYWILIGQSGLGSLLQSLDSRIFQRLTSSIELTPITAKELKAAIDIRIQKFHKAGSGFSPIPESIYQRLYHCSNGEIRFVFKYCSAICMAVVESVRKVILKRDIKDPIRNKQLFLQTLGYHMINNEFKDKDCLEILKAIVKKEFDGLNLKIKEKEILYQIGQRVQVRAKDAKEFGFKSMQDFSKLAEQNLLLKKQEGRAIVYELRGLSLLANEFSLLHSQNGNSNG